MSYSYMYADDRDDLHTTTTSTPILRRSSTISTNSSRSTIQSIPTRSTIQSIHTPFRERVEHAWDSLCNTWDFLCNTFSALSGYWMRWCWFITPQNAICLVLLFLLLMGFSSPERTVVDKMIQMGNLVSVQEQTIRREAALAEFKEFQVQVVAVKEELGAHQKALRSVQNELGNLDATVRKFSDQMQGIQSEVSEVQAMVEKWAEVTQSTEKSCNISSKVNNLDSVVKQVASQLKGLQSHVQEVDKELKAVSELGSHLRTEEEPPLPVHNLASRRNGAFVVVEQTSSQIIAGSLLKRVSAAIWSPESHQWPVTERSSISSGDAFCFNGSIGVLTVALSTPSPISSVLYEHDYWSIDMPISAPKEYRVKICTDDDCEEQHEIGKCDYIAERKKVAQLCTLRNPSLMARKLRLEVLSNHGQDYTCLYSLKAF